jgi:hypothetical protein
VGYCGKWYSFEETRSPAGIGLQCHKHQANVRQTPLTWWRQNRNRPSSVSSSTMIGSQKSQTIFNHSSNITKSKSRMVWRSVTTGHIWVHCKQPTRRFWCRSGYRHREWLVRDNGASESKFCSIPTAAEGVSTQWSSWHEGSSIPDIVFPVVTSLGSKWLRYGRCKTHWQQKPLIQRPVNTMTRFLR